MKPAQIAATLLLTAFPSLAPAGTMKLPEVMPAVTASLPDDWMPKRSEIGVLAESPDNVASIYLEVVAEEETESLIEDSIKWLTEKYGVSVDTATKTPKDFEDDGRKWKRFSWTGNSKEWGPTVIGFLSTDAGGGKLLTVTYWISKRDSEKSLETLGKIFKSVKPVP
ncbi:hypothetical protein [Prosthecobacter sp.]|uniref:hypothetical protein n=1 Tax=Prosthecobacter sp. TaxID=1965333 RepID=UPI003782FAC2